MITLANPITEPVTVLPPLIDRAAAAYCVRPVDVRSARRNTSAVRARWAVAWAAFKGTEYSYPRIGRELGGRDHTTIMHGVRQAEALRLSDPVFRALCDALLDHLEARN